MIAKSKVYKLFTIPYFAISLYVGFLFIEIWPSYKYTTYTMPNCSNTYLTKIEYTEFLNRNFAFAYGKYNSNGFPKLECLTSYEVSGRDGLIELYVNCKNNVIYVHPQAGMFKNVSRNDKKIIVEEISWSELDSTKNKNKMLHIIEE